MANLAKQIELAEKLQDANGVSEPLIKICHLLMKYLPESPLYALIQHLEIPQPIDIYKKIAPLQKSLFDKSLFEQVELERKRLGAEPVAKIRARVEKALIQSIPVCPRSQRQLNR